MPGLGRKVFTAGDVLTASDMQNYVMDQTVMNFAGTAARSSAIATPTEGMVSYRQDAKGLEYYNGTAFVGLPGLELIKVQTVGTGVTTINVTNAFNSTYDNYRILIQINSTNGGAGGYISLNGITSQGLNLSNFMAYGVTTINGYQQSGATNLNIFFNNANATPMTAQLDIFNPNVAARKNGNYTSQAGNGTASGNFSLTSTVQATGFTIGKDSSETMTGGTIAVYGYRKAI